MSESTVVKYRIDSEDRLAEVNDAWTAFAEANAGEGLLPPSVLGRSFWSFIHARPPADRRGIHCRRIALGLVVRLVATRLQT